MRTTRLLTLVVGATLLAGCSGGTTISTHTETAYLIRGTQIPSYSCTAASNGGPINVPPSSLTKIRLCPLVGYPTRTPAVSVSRADPRFARLVSALSAQDQTATPGTMCPAYANLPQPVIGEALAGPMFIHIPVDGCGHYLSAAATALAALRPQS